MAMLRKESPRPGWHPTPRAMQSNSRTLKMYPPARWRNVDFAAINRAALARLPELLARWLPGGRWEGAEYVVKNPTRADDRPGSFKINRSGRWADWATGDSGGDPVSLAAFLHGLSQPEAAQRLAGMLGMGDRHER